MISIIIPVRNTPEKLKKCLASLGKQSFNDFEVIVVDDGSDKEIEKQKNREIKGIDI